MHNGPFPPEHPEWSRDAVIYQINTRQFTSAGTFAAAQEQLPRLKAFVAAAHGQGRHGILDWVANHTAWDNPLVEQHPEWFKRDASGEFHSPAWTDWADVIQLDYSQPGLREYMTQAMQWWVREVDMDGFRCDVAGFVPLDFWNGLRAELDAIRPVFMLAEWETRDLHARAFDMSYAWSWYQTVHDIATGRADVSALEIYHYGDENAWPEDGIRMLFTSNHDKNAWEGTEFEAFGDALENAIVLSFVSKGMPLIYNGQEAGNPKRLAFFEKDPNVWGEHPLDDLFRRLIALKKAQRVLWNGRWGAKMVQVVNDAPADVFSFLRPGESGRVFGAFNFSGEDREVIFSGSLHAGPYRDFASGQTVTIYAGKPLALPAWGFKVLVH